MSRSSPRGWLQQLKNVGRSAAPTSADKVVLAFCSVTIVFLISGHFAHVKPVRIYVSPLPSLNPNDPIISGTGFVPDAVYPTTPPPAMNGALKFYGSWLGSNTPTGTVHTPWYSANSDPYIFVAGYPSRIGNELLCEVQTARSGVVRLRVLRVNEPEPHESWSLKKISLRAIPEPVKYRIVAEDGSTSFWLGFSQPFLITGTDYLRLGKHLLLIIGATVSSILFFLSPGLILRQKRAQSPGQLAFIWVPFPGLLGMALLGLAAWILPNVIGPDTMEPRTVSVSALGMWALYVIYRSVRVPISTFMSPIEQRVLLVTLVLMGIAVAKSIYSVGPVGELFGNEISRTLEVGPRSDTRISFNIVQLVALGSGPYSPLATSLYETLNFSYRGPMSGLATAPIVLAGPVQVPRNIRGIWWTPFDAQGFEAYRVAMIVMAASSLLTVFGLAILFLPERWAFFAYLIAATAPFIVHELYFTWPKLCAASFVLLAAYLVCHARYFLAGLLLGIGYLWHPAALVWTPCLLSLIFFLLPKTMSIPRRIYRCALRAVLTGAGIAICVVFWRIVNGIHFAQKEFLYYARQCFIYRVTLPNWIRTRIYSVTNTFVPLTVFILDPSDPNVNSLEAPSPPVVRFYFQYCYSVPFGSGIAFFCCGLLRVLTVGFRKARACLVLLFIVPLFLYSVYWGATITGMLWENLHAWFLGVMISAAILWKKYLRRSQRFWRACNWALLFRGAETLLMLLLPPVWSQQIFLQRRFALTDATALIGMLAGSVWLYTYTFKYSENLRHRNNPE